VYCPQRKLNFTSRASQNGIATSTGFMNLGSAVFGGVPISHGAGGMAAHVAFGARTGGAPIIFGLIAQPVLGVILFLTRAQLALGSCDFSKNKGERFITLATAAFALWNVGLAFVIGILLQQIDRRGWLRL
jgi:hypothetical protein